MERRGGAGELRRVAADLGQRREATVAVERAILDALRHDGSGGLHEAPCEGAVRAPADEARGRGEGEIQIAARIRSTRPPRPAILRATGANRAEIELLDAEEGVSPGQACVFYEPDSTRVLGGGWISHRRGG